MAIILHPDVADNYVNWPKKLTSIARNERWFFPGTTSISGIYIRDPGIANVTYVAAAGNTHIDAASFSPANNTDVITVSAISDRDGKCGGLGPPTRVYAGNMSGFVNDDTFATFSNYGSA